MTEVIDFTTDHLKEINEHGIRVRTLEDKVDDLSDLKENIKLLTYIQKEQSAFNKEQSKVNEEVSNTLVAINSNLKTLNKQLPEIDKKVSNLENKFEEIEKKNNIDLRDIAKETTKKHLIDGKSIAIGAIGGASLIPLLIELIKLLISKIGNI